MGGNSGGNNSGDRDTYNPVSGKQYSKPRKNPVADFIRGGGVTGAIVKGIKKQVEISKKKKVERKINDSLIGTPDYQGSVAKKPTKVTTPIGGNDRNDNPPPKVETPKVETKKSVEQPKVKSQMDNTKVKSKAIIADKVAPTKTDTKASADEILLKNKRKGRKKTVLTSVTGVEGYPTLSRRTLLG